MIQKFHRWRFLILEFFKEFFGKGIGGYLLTDAILTSFNQKD
jgi:hypothetical protein